MLAKSVLIIATLACFGQRPGGDQRLLAIVWLVRSRVLLLLPRPFGGGGRHAQSRCKSILPPVQLTTGKCSHHPGRRHREARAHHGNQKESEQRGSDIIAARHYSNSSRCLRFFAETAVHVAVAEISAAAANSIEHGKWTASILRRWSDGGQTKRQNCWSVAGHKSQAPLRPSLLLLRVRGGDCIDDMTQLSLTHHLPDSHDARARHEEQRSRIAHNQ